MVTEKLSLIIIIVLLALAPLSEAGYEPVGTFEIGTRYVDGTTFDPDTDILDISDSLYLSIYNEEEFGWPSGFGYWWALVCDPSLATITGGEAGPAAYKVGFYGSPVGHIYGLPGDGEHGWIGYETEPPIYAAGLYMYNILYSPQSVGDVTVSFWHTTQVDTYGVIDSIVIHQIPEPTTIALLGLGVLLLRRRKY